MASVPSVQCFGKKKTGRLSFFPTGNSMGMNPCADIFNFHSHRCRPLQGMINAYTPSAPIRCFEISGRKTVGKELCTKRRTGMEFWEDLRNNMLRDYRGHTHIELDKMLRLFYSKARASSRLTDSPSPWFSPRSSVSRYAHYIRSTNSRAPQQKGIARIASDNGNGKASPNSVSDTSRSKF